MDSRGLVRSIQPEQCEDSLSEREWDIMAPADQAPRNGDIADVPSTLRADARPARKAAPREITLADVARVRGVLRARAARLRYTLGGRNDPAVLCQIEAYEDAAAEVEDLLTASHSPSRRS